MTLEKADSIASHITDIFANKPRKNFCRRSQLRGYSFIEISHAFALVIAGRRQIAGDNPEMKAECAKFADLAGGLIFSFRMGVISDEDAEKIARLQPNSADYNREFLKIVHDYLDNTAPEWEELLKEETASSFNLFCWTLNHEDPLYWQKVYTHLGLPYDENSPIGLPNIELGGKSQPTFFQSMVFSHEFHTARKTREQKYYKVIGWIIIASIIIWLIWELVPELFKK